MNNKAPDIKAWSEQVASLGVDVLVDRGLIKKDDFEKAVAIVVEKMFVRLSIGNLIFSSANHYN